MKKRWLCCGLLSAVLVLASCDASDDTDETFEISYDGGGTTLFTGGSLQLHAVLDGCAVAADWQTSDAAVATVDAGLLRGIKSGVVTISAVSGEKSASVDVFVAGLKSRPSAVGDIVFDDGTAVAYSEHLRFSQQVKAKAVGVVYTTTGGIKAVSKKAPDKAVVCQRGAGSWNDTRQQYYHSSREAYDFVSGISGSWSMPSVADMQRISSAFGIVERSLAVCEGRVLHYTSDSRNLYWTSDGTLAEWDNTADCGESYTVDILTGKQVLCNNFQSRHSVLAVKAY